jgi:hypothetical protein
VNWGETCLLNPSIIPLNVEVDRMKLVYRAKDTKRSISYKKGKERINSNFCLDCLGGSKPVVLS